MWGEVALLITYPSDLPMMLRRSYVTHKPVELAVALGRPFCDEAGKVAHRSEQVETSHSGSVEYFHQHFGGQRLENSTICRVVSVCVGVGRRFLRCLENSCSTYTGSATIPGGGLGSLDPLQPLALLGANASIWSF